MQSHRKNSSKKNLHLVGVLKVTTKEKSRIWIQGRIRKSVIQIRIRINTLRIRNNAYEYTVFMPCFVIMHLSSERNISKFKKEAKVSMNNDSFVAGCGLKTDFYNKEKPAILLTEQQQVGNSVARSN